MPLASGTLQRSVQAVEQQGAIGQAGEGIELGHELQAGEHLLPLDEGNQLGCQVVQQLPVDGLVA